MLLVFLNWQRFSPPLFILFISYLRLTFFCFLFKDFFNLLTSLDLLIFLKVIPLLHTAKSLIPTSIPILSPVNLTTGISTSIPTDKYQYLLSKLILGLVYLTPIGTCSLAFNL